MAAASTSTGASIPAEPAAAPTPAPAPLSPADFKAFNRLADMMDAYHNHFRMQWRALYGAVSPPTSSSDAKPLSARALINTSLSFLSHLSTHHGIEETYIFPELSRRMPAFKPDAPALQQHKQIHAGMDALEAYMEACKTGERELRREEVKELMDGFGTVLWTHLDEEVRSLGAEEMRKYWTKEEVKGLMF